MRVSDYIITFLEKKSVDTIFMITGGQAMFLNDAVFRSKKITPIFVHHEQAAGMAAEAFGRVSQKLGVAMVTAGPAAVNVLNGVVGGWVDSSPMMVISGQSALPNVEYMAKTGIRQLGLQGIYTEPMARAYTKYFVTVDDPANIAYFLEKAYYEATTGRPGPVWLEVPLDVQRMEVPEKLIKHFEATKLMSTTITLKQQIRQCIDLLVASKRPLFYVGQGVRIADATKELDAVLKKTKIPVIVARLGIDLVASDSKLFVGRPGLYGDRPANLAVQTADLIIAVGARLDSGAVGYDAKNWGKHAHKIIVDIDPKELEKPGLTNTTKIQADAKDFLIELLAQSVKVSVPDTKKWISVLQTWRALYPTVTPAYKKEKPVNSYYFSERLSELASPKDIVVVDTSSPFHVVCQAWKIKKGQRFLTTGGISTMGYWPAGMGACMAGGRKQTLVITGDGCLQMNIQELATIKGNKLPIKLFVIDNDGYLLIRHTQQIHMEGRLLGESPKTGLWIPDTMKIAKAYDIKAIEIRNVSELDRKLKEVLAFDGPVICNVLSPKWQPVIPRISSEKMPDGTMVSHAYEDLYPFLPKAELEKILSIADVVSTPQKEVNSKGKHGKSDWG